MRWTFRDFLPMVTPRLLRAPHPYLSFSYITGGCVFPSNIYWLDAWETTLLLRQTLWSFCSLGLKMVAGEGLEPSTHRLWACSSANWSTPQSKNMVREFIPIEFWSCSRHHSKGRGTLPYKRKGKLLSVPQKSSRNRERLCHFCRMIFVGCCKFPWNWVLFWVITSHSWTTHLLLAYGILGGVPEIFLLHRRHLGFSGFAALPQRFHLHGRWFPLSQGYLHLGSRCTLQHQL